MKTMRNILLGLTALLIGICTIQAENINKQKGRKSGNGWSSIGPANVSGRVLAIHVDINNSQKIYAGTAGGGLWVTTNGGASWNRCTEYTGSAAVSAIAQGNDGRLFIGTGEGLNSYYTDPGVKTNISPYGIIGDGIYISNDGGNTFSQVASTSTWEAVNSMAYDKKNNKLYVGTSEGLKVSTDNGTSFVNAIAGNTNKTFDVEVGSDGTVICALYSGNGDVLVSTDNGSTFNSVCGTDTTKLPSVAGRFSVAIAPSDPNTMYAFAEANYGQFYGVYASNDKGVTWKQIRKPSPDGYDDPMSGSGTYANVISVSPSDPGKYFVGSRYLYEAARQGTSDNYSWLPRATNYTNSKSMTVHAIFYTNQTIYIGTSSGIYRSTNDGVAFNQLSRYLTNLQSYSISVANDGRVIAGTRENGSIYMMNPNGPDAYGTDLGLFGDGGKSVFSLIKTEALYYLSTYGIGYRRASYSSDAQNPSQWYGNTYSLVSSASATAPRWAPGQSNINSLSSNYIASPFIMWESVNDQNSQDTVTYIADKDYAPGEAICAKSARNRYPIWTTNPNSDTLHMKDTLFVKDIVTSRLFLGGGPYKLSASDARGIGASVYMSLTALNYDVTQVWTCVFRTKDTTEQVMDLAVSNDGDHLFILTKKIMSSAYSIYRVTGFDQYRSLVDLDVSKMVYDSIAGIFDDNDRRKLVNDTLVYETVLALDGDILSITLDPQINDNLFYTSNSPGGVFPRMKLIKNATTATLSTVDITEKEGSGIPENVPVYTSLIEMSNSNIAYVGTELGVYKTENFSSSSPTWELYNEGMDISVPVFQLFQQTQSIPGTYSVTYDGSGTPATIDFPGVSNWGIIYAATHGEGLFVDDTYKKTGIAPSPGPIVDVNDNKLKVYPNPTSSIIFIDYVLESLNSQVQLNIVDVTGKIVYTKDLGSRDAGAHSETLDCSHLPNGFYFINMITGQHNKVAKIIVSR